MELFRIPGSSASITTELPIFQADEDTSDVVYIRWLDSGSGGDEVNTHIERTTYTSGMSPVVKYAFGKWSNRASIAEENWLSLRDYQAWLSDNQIA